MTQTTKILLVDDHQIILDGIRMMLKDAPEMQICGTAHSGKQAMALARKLLPDVVIADISMPGMNGIDLTRELKVLLPRVGVIILSMYTSEDYICRLVGVGANGYLTKQDTTRVELLEAIRAVSTGGEYFSGEVREIITQKYFDRARKGKPNPNQPVQPTPREAEILKLYADGLSNQEIAEKLFISSKTVEAHKNNIMQKFNFKSTVEMVKYAIRHQMTDF